VRRAASGHGGVRVAAVALCALAVTGTLRAGAPASPAVGVRSEPLAVRIDRYVHSMVGAREFQGAVLVARNGRLLFARGFGYANRERGIPNRPTTLFRLVLATELFDRIAVLQLRDAGQLGLDDGVCRYVTRCPPSWRTITIKALLDHRSGLADVHPLARVTLPPTIEQAMAWLRRQPVHPTRRDPSPAATIVLAHVIERASGEEWFPYLRGHILRPAHMTATVPDAQASRRTRAVGYLLPSLRRGRDVSFTRPDPAQGLWSTVLDLYRLDEALYRGAVLAYDSVGELYPPREHVVDGEHAWDVGDGFYALAGRHTPDRLLVVLLANGRKLNYRFYEIENRVAAMSVGRRRVGPIRAGPSELAFVGPNGVLAVAAADGSQPRNLTTIYEGAVLAPSWSRDGRRLAFTRCNRASCAVYLIGVDGTGERRLVGGSWPTWAPDGRTLGYVGADGRLRLVTVASGRSRLLPGPPVLPGGGLSWSPDGRWILFFGGFYGGEQSHNDLRNRLLVVPASGGRPRVISRSPGFYVTSSVAWSPNSKTITYSRRDRIGAAIGSAEAFLASPDGTGARPLGGGAYRPPRFTPDGTQIAFNLGLGCKLRLVPIAGGAGRTLPLEACEPVWRPGTTVGG
jgi:CubicO group peptidase (beta-lactamase class C family)